MQNKKKNEEMTEAQESTKEESDARARARRALLGFFKTIISIQVQTIVGLLIAVFTQGIGVSFILPVEWRLPIFMLGTGFLASLAFCQWCKMFWTARLWSAALVARAKGFSEIFRGSLNSHKKKVIEETEIAKLYMGSEELFIENCNRLQASLIFLGKETKHELFLSLLASCVFAFNPLVPWPSGIFSQYKDSVFVFACIALVGYFYWVRFWKCCSTQQIGQWLRSRDLQQLVGLEYKH